jgi:hypothetical protein
LQEREDIAMIGTGSSISMMIFVPAKFSTDQESLSTAARLSTGVRAARRKLATHRFCLFSKELGLRFRDSKYI